MVAGEAPAVEVANEVLRGAATERAAGVDVADEHPLLLPGSAHRHLHQVGALPHAVVAAIFLAKRALVGPVLQVVARIDAHLLPCGQNEVPLLDVLVPESLRVAEVLLGAHQHGVAAILLEGRSVVLRHGHRLHLAGSSRGVEGHHLAVLLVDHARAAEDAAQCVGLDGRGLCLPVNKVLRGRVAPRHVLPLRAVGVPLIIKVVHAILVEHTIGIVHPAIHRRVVKQRAILFAVRRVELVALLHLLPASEVFHSPGEAAVAVEGDVEQHVGSVEAPDVQWHVVVHPVYGQLHVQRLHLVVVHQHANARIVLSLLHRQQQVVLVHLHPLHGMVAAQQPWRLGSGGNRRHHHDNQCQ